MANKPAMIKQADAKRLFKAAMAAGFGEAKIILHPDGRIEAAVSVSESAPAVKANSWDDLL